jgi:predicted RNA-binding protein associated with RNAse of E/G family
MADMTTSRQIPHAPKLEIFDVAGRTNTDPKGISREVEEYRVEPFGLYLARPTPGRRQFRYLESWLLPELNLRVTDFWFNPGHERDQDFYLDIVTVEVHDGIWRATDLYLDILLRQHRGVTVLDTDELLDAVDAGLLPPAIAHNALETTYTTVDALARHGYDLAAWLDTLGVTLDWRRHPPAG